MKNYDERNRRRRERYRDDPEYRERLRRQNRESYQRHREKRLAKQKRRYYAMKSEELQRHKEYRVKRMVLTSNGRVLYGYKRERPDGCEVCGRTGGVLAYHHYDDEDLMKGLWLCPPCHMMAHQIDKELHVKYLQLKRDLLESTRREDRDP